jgi:hypothetical protein
MELNNKIEDLFKKMNNGFLDTHPTIINMWKLFITKRYTALINNIGECEKMLDNLDTKNDLTDMEILTLYNVYNQEPN